MITKKEIGIFRDRCSVHSSLADDMNAALDELEQLQAKLKEARKCPQCKGEGRLHNEPAFAKVTCWLCMGSGVTSIQHLWDKIMYPKSEEA